jgi:hypothetical protein
MVVNYSEKSFVKLALGGKVIKYLVNLPIVTPQYFLGLKCCTNLLLFQGKLKVLKITTVI